MSVSSLPNLLNQLNKILLLGASGKQNIVLFNDFNKISNEPTQI
jgi:hypothetical protein